MENLLEEINALTLKLDTISDFFYQQKDAEGYQGVNLILKDIEVCFAKVLQYKAENGNLEFDEKNFIKTLEECISALEQKDTVLLADILNYDIKDAFTELSEQLAS